MCASALLEKTCRTAWHPLGGDAMLPQGMDCLSLMVSLASAGIPMGSPLPGSAPLLLQGRPRKGTHALNCSVLPLSCPLCRVK